MHQNKPKYILSLVYGDGEKIIILKILQIENNIVLRIHGPISPQASRWAKNDIRTKDELLNNME